MNLRSDILLYTGAKKQRNLETDLNELRNPMHRVRSLSSASQDTLEEMGITKDRILNRRPPMFTSSPIKTPPGRRPRETSPFRDPKQDSIVSTRYSRVGNM